MATSWSPSFSGFLFVPLGRPQISFPRPRGSHHLQHRAALRAPLRNHPKGTQVPGPFLFFFFGGGGLRVVLCSTSLRFFFQSSQRWRFLLFLLFFPLFLDDIGVCVPKGATRGRVRAICKGVSGLERIGRKALNPDSAACLGPPFLSFSLGAGCGLHLFDDRTKGATSFLEVGCSHFCESPRYSLGKNGDQAVMDGHPALVSQKCRFPRPCLKWNLHTSVV